ncbi:response regulator [Chryseotalea sanaruensis]|nr:response regulator transcription factor [Chryseotalea sanaruensis]
MRILKVVTVDDSPIIAERLQTILAQIDHINFVGNANNITSALSLIDHAQPQVVILDINLEADLPDLNGINLLIMLRKKYLNMKIIMLTNITHLQYRNTCLANGADYFLDKSNEFEKITEIVGGFTKQAERNFISNEE